MTDIDPIDKELGNNLRFLRLIGGLTQASVGEILGVTFQQVQKYEQGTNRISARTLYKLRVPLGVTYEDFFTPITDNPLPPLTKEQDKITVSVIRYLNNIPSMRRKRAILKLIKELASEQ